MFIYYYDKLCITVFIIYIRAAGNGKRERGNGKQERATGGSKPGSPAERTTASVHGAPALPRGPTSYIFNGFKFCDIEGACSSQNTHTKLSTHPLTPFSLLCPAFVSIMCVLKQNFTYAFSLMFEVSIQLNKIIQLLVFKTMDVNV